uniref:VPS10 domain-containing protein n=1 Tax=Pyrodinium bahamense TaxID=73915 RepID=A0A7S0AB98_9DINO
MAGHRSMDWARRAAILCLVVARTGLGKKVEVKEVTFDSPVNDIQWLGKDQSTVLVQTAKGRLYRSTNKGADWNDISDKLKSDVSDSDSPAPIVVDQIVKSQADLDTVLVAGTQQSHFISTDRGQTWRRLRQTSTIHTFLFHKTRAKWALLSTWTSACEASKRVGKRKSDSGKDSDDGEPCNHMLYLTKDLGRTFILVCSYVVQFSWGDIAHEQQDRIYFTHFKKREGDQPKLTMWSKDVDFSYTADAGRTIVPLVHMGNKFLVSHSFLFVAKLKDSASQTVNLMVSNDGGVVFRSAQLPQEIDEKSYTILDTSEGAVMLHVNHGTKDRMFGTGNLYISDKEGVRYTLSLQNNVRGSSGDCEFDKVLSLEGVYMANFRDTEGSTNAKDATTGKKAEAAKEAEELEEANEKGTEVDKRRSPKSKSKSESVVRTVISFDKGGVWSYLKPPKVDSTGKQVECPQDRCWLHLHGVTNFHNYAPFYSTENAVGIIMGTGNVGPYLRFEQDQTNTYLSRDGGLTWAEVHKGAFIYEYGDHGGLVLMADDIKKTKQVVFSWNEGQSWYDFELSNYPLEVDNIVTEPNATSTKFLLYGTRGDAGVMYHLDFEALGQPPCKGVWAADSVSSDYETWTPSDGRGADKCILGRQITYTRRKQTSECFNGEQFERPVVKKNCECKEDNFECEMGFTRKVDSLECKFVDDGSITVPTTCTSSDFFYVMAHRKVTGDNCEGGWQPKKTAVPCPRNSKMSRGAMSVLGTIGMIGTVMGAVTFLANSERFKGFFANYGFDTFNAVKYSTIGDRVPETALESVGANFDHGDFDRDDGNYGGGSSQLMSYTDSSRDRDRGRERSYDQDRERDRERRRGLDTAAAPVPRLQRPPGAGSAAPSAAAGGGDDFDLL